MRRLLALIMVAGVMFGMSSCAKKENFSVSKDEPAIYLEITGAKASSFDETPDWAPPPDPMAPVDRDMTTRWSPKLGLDNEWIYFDFGKEKVFNKIVIKWERAYATEYKVETSNDAKKWDKLVYKKDGKGETEEFTFPPVKARYIKVTGIQRCNPDWGFSIWELEIYGPKSLNPGEKEVNVDKEHERLEKEKTEISAMIDEAKTPLKPLTLDEMQNGVCYTSWVYDEWLNPMSDKMLVFMKKMGVNAVAIVVPAYQKEITSETIFTNDKEGGDTPGDAAIKHAIDTCHKLGMKVMLKPHVDPRDNSPRTDIVASDAWFVSYEQYVMRYAKMAQELNVEIFAVGTEFEGTTFSKWENQWRNVIAKVKSVYKGYTVYCANWTEYKTVPFWDMVDFIGIDAYFMLTNKNDPTKEELVAAWTKIADDIQAWLVEKNINKPLLFTEYGCPSSDAGNKQPWASITNVEDQNEQADVIDAMFTVMSQRPFFKGGYLWQFFPQERWSPLGFTVKGKKAEEAIRKWYKQK